MKKELDEELCKNYPSLFANRHGDMKTTAMCWGFECGAGWYTLVDTLCALIVWDIDHNKCPPVIVTQVKEKYGTLRFYFNGGNDNIEAYATFAEQLSGTICESCSHPGTFRDAGWLRTLCDSCEEKYQKRMS